MKKLPFSYWHIFYWVAIGVLGYLYFFDSSDLKKDIMILDTLNQNVNNYKGAIQSKKGLIYHKLNTYCLQDQYISETPTIERIDDDIEDNSHIIDDFRDELVKYCGGASPKNSIMVDYENKYKNKLFFNKVKLDSLSKILKIAVKQIKFASDSLHFNPNAEYFVSENHLKNNEIRNIANGTPIEALQYLTMLKADLYKDVLLLYGRYQESLPPHEDFMKIGVITTKNKIKQGETFDMGITFANAGSDCTLNKDYGVSYFVDGEKVKNRMGLFALFSKKATKKGKNKVKIEVKYTDPFTHEERPIVRTERTFYVE